MSDDRELSIEIGGSESGELGGGSRQQSRRGSRSGHGPGSRRGAPGAIWVEGYVRADGTRVHGHYRSLRRR